MRKNDKLFIDLLNNVRVSNTDDDHSRQDLYMNLIKIIQKYRAQLFRE